MLTLITIKQAESFLHFGSKFNFDQQRRQYTYYTRSESIFIILSTLPMIIHVMYTDHLIEELINCRKKIVDPPKNIKGNRNTFLKTSFTFTSIDEKYNFTGFITAHLMFKENFSIGLAYNPKGEKGTIVLLRCNGPHGGLKGMAHHAVCHLHLSTAERINLNLKPEGNIMLTQEYSTLETAVQFYIKHINLSPEDRQKFFAPPSTQIDLFGV